MRRLQTKNFAYKYHKLFKITQNKFEPEQLKIAFQHQA